MPYEKEHIVCKIIYLLYQDNEIMRPWILRVAESLRRTWFWAEMVLAFAW